MGVRNKKAAKEREERIKQSLPVIKTRSHTQSIQTKAKQAKTINQKQPHELEKISERKKSANSAIMEKPKFDMLLLHLPTFDGRKENNIKFYLQQFEDLAKNMDLEEAQKVTMLKAKFSGAARETLINTPELCEEQKFEQLKEKLKNEFQSKKTLEETQSEFKALKQRPEQSIEEFSKVFKLKSLKYIQKAGHANKKDAMDFFDKIKVQEFLNMIRPDIAFEIRKTGVESLEDVITKAKQIEAAINSMPKMEAVNNNTQTSKAANETLLNLTTQQMTELQELRKQFENFKLSKNEEKMPKGKFCAICKVKFHDTEECFYNGKNKNNKKNTSRNYANTGTNFSKNNYNYTTPYNVYPPNMMPVMHHQTGYVHRDSYGSAPYNYNPYIGQNIPHMSHDYRGYNYDSQDRDQHGDNYRYNRNIRGNEQNRNYRRDNKFDNKKSNTYNKNQGNE